METTNTPSGRDLVTAANHIAVALGYTHTEVTDLAHVLELDGRADWPTADLLLIALAELTRRDPGRRDLVGALEAGEILGGPGGPLSRTRVNQLAQRPDFPTSRYELAGARIWTRADIVGFGQRWDRRQGRPRTRAAVPPGQALVLLTVGDDAHLVTASHPRNAPLVVPAARIAEQAGLPANELPGKWFTVERLDQDDADGFQLLHDPRE
ncbi:hypothetical protein [Sphaerisporangium aureirubrum]|uniref:Uncharacterized protein n=1 Tax=Sphaerisporangium aureirubrum TaxID=1544736 RepID=A0ABW1NCC3_9ACTN